MKKFGMIILVLFVLVIVGAVALTVALPSLVNLEKVRVAAEEKASEALGRKVSISGTSFTLWGGPRVKLEGLSISEARGFGDGSFASLDSFDLRVRFFPLLRRKIEVEHINIVSPRIRLIRSRSGVWNWKDLVPKEMEVEKTTTDIKPAGTGGDSRLPVDMLVEDIKVTGGEIFYADETIDRLKAGITISGINLALRDLSLDKPIAIKASAGLNGKTNDLLIGGKVGPVGKIPDPEKVPFNITVDAPAFDLARIKNLAGPLPVDISGSVASKRTVKGTMSKGVAFEHAATLKDISITSRDGTPMVRNFSGTTTQRGFFDTSRKILRFDSFTLDIDRAKISAAGTIRNPGPKGRVNLTISSEPIPLASWDRIFPAMGSIATLAGDVTVSGTITGSYGRDLLAKVDFTSSNFELDRGPALLGKDESTDGQGGEGREQNDTFKPVGNSPVSFSGNVSVAKGRFEKVNFDNLTAVMSFAGTKFSLDRMVFSAFGGRMAGSAWTDLGRDLLRFGSSMKMKNVEINEAITAFSSLGGMIYGKVSSEMEIRGEGTVFEDVKSTLNGKGKTDIGEGRLTKTNVLKGAGGAASLLGLGSGQNETRFDAISADYTIGGGKINISKAIISTRDWALTATGSIGLDRSLSMKSRMALADSLSVRIPTKRQDLFPRDSTGRLQIPLKIGGTVNFPKFTLDTAVMAKAAGAAARKKAEKKVQQKVQKKQDEIRQKLEKDINESLKNLFK